MMIFNLEFLNDHRMIINNRVPTSHPPPHLFGIQLLLVLLCVILILTQYLVISIINFDYMLQVVRLCAKSREAVSSPVEHLTLHYQVHPFVAFM
jgi:hypothetical protein